MQKIYVLLRHDQQTGPYSLEEIIQFDLKPYDLIWIEGKSAGWYYPQELAALRPYLSFLPQKPKPVQPPELPGNKVVDSPKEKPQATPIFTPLHNAPPVSPIPADTGKGLEQAVYAQFRQPKAESAPVNTPSPAVRNKTPKGSVVAALAVLIVGAVFAASWILNRQPEEEKAEATPVMETAAPNETEAMDGVQDKLEGETKRTAAVPRQKTARHKPLSSQATAVVKPNTPQKRQQEPDHEQPPFNDRGTTPSVSTEEPAADGETVWANEGESGEAADAPQEKKKKLRDKIFDLFRKKPEEERTPAETNNGERVATRRESSANLAQMVHVRFDIPNNWMMGIKGAKATLVNRSAETVQKAVVEVQYYDEDNNLLQKRTVSFEKVGGKDSKTISIPDHPAATHVDYSLVSVTGKPAA